MDFPKKQAQRLMPLYLLEYSEKLFTNHPDPSAPWGGGGGSDYTAGQGITITNNEISVDTNVVASKNDLNAYIKNNDTSYSSIFRGQYAAVKDEGSYNTTIYGDGAIKKVVPHQLPYGDHAYTYSLPDKAGTIALTSDLPSLSGYATETWVQNQGYITNAALNNYVTTTQLNDALDDYALKTEIPTDVSQLYNDAGYATQTWVQNQGYATSSEIPTNYVTTDTEQTITGLKTIGETSGTISEVDFSGFTFKLSNKAINNPEADIKIRNASYNGYQYPTIYSTKGLYVNLAKIKLGDDGNNTYGITMPDSSTWESDRVLATTNDIPSLDGYATQTWVQNQGYISNIDLSNYPEIVDVTNGFPDETKTAEILANPSKYVIHGTTKYGSRVYHIFASYAGNVTTNGHTWMQVIRVPSNSNNYVNYVLKPYAFCYEEGTWRGPVVYLWKISYSDIYNAPEIPTVNNPTITFTQGGATKGTITLNQSGDQTIALDAAGSNYTAGTGIDITNNEISIDNTVALKSEIPSLDGYATQTWVENKGYATSSSLATVATTGSYNDLTDKPSIPSTATSTSTSTVTPETGTFVTGTSTNTTNVVNSVTYTPSSETLTFTYADDTTASFTFLTSSTTVTSGTTSVVTSVTDSTSNAMTGATVSTSTTTTLS